VSAQDESWKSLAHLLLAAWESEDPRDHHDDCDIAQGDAEECTCARPEVRQHAHAMLAGKKAEPGESKRLFELYYASLSVPPPDDPKPRAHIRVVK
jgi:hypothetical protein